VVVAFCLYTDFKYCSKFHYRFTCGSCVSNTVISSDSRTVQSLPFAGFIEMSVTSNTRSWFIPRFYRDVGPLASHIVSCIFHGVFPIFTMADVPLNDKDEMTRMMLTTMMLTTNNDDDDGEDTLLHKVTRR
jgi:hypothetical protein